MIKYFNLLTATENFEGADTWVIVALGIIAGLIALTGVVATAISGYLGIAYFRYNHTKNSCGKTGKEVAREILDKNDLPKIKVSATGSLLFGNSYSHFFRKVRLRRLTWKKKSVASLAMAAQKSSLAILDKENDPDMETRIRLTPFIYFGPLAFIPLIIIGIILDVLMFGFNNMICTLICGAFGLLVYVVSIIMSVKVLKTEVKAQKRAYEILEKEGLATEEELKMCKKLFKLYNIEYINNIVISVLELIYRILSVIASLQSNSSENSD